MTSGLDPSLTFASFVVGSENRLAWEAARTAAESPGSAYNPLFIYSDTGLGKTHLLVAIANRAREVQPDILVIYTPLERLIRDLAAESAAEEAFGDADILLIDDLQFVGEHASSQQTLFHVLDRLLMAGKQVALACDRPPLELGELDDRLLSRFSGGLVVDIGRPMLDTRRSILELRLTAVREDVRPEVVDAIARLAIENVRQLKGALNRVLAAQKSEGRSIQADEVDRLLADIVGDGDLPWLTEIRGRTRGEFEEFLTDVSSAVEEALGAPTWREDVARAILKWEAEGYSTSRLAECLDSGTAADAGSVIQTYERDIAELNAIGEEVARLGLELPRELSIKDPDGLGELREFLERARRTELSLDDFFLDSEKIVWDWPVLEDRLIESWNDGY